MPDRREYLNDTEEGMKVCVENYLANMWKALPARVTSVNLVAQTIEAQPLIQAKVRQDDNSVVDVTLPLVINCPIVWPRAGGYALTFPVKQGDEVLIIFADRCIDQWWQTAEVSPQIDLRMHDLSDGFAILAPTSQPKRLSDVSSTSVQLRNTANDCTISITDDGDVTITATGSVNVNAQNASISAENTLNLNGETVTITGDLVQIESSTFKVSSSTIDSTGGTASLVQEVIGGYHISVDDSDKERPVVNWTGV